ncbi:CPBP family intramembrane glutamic endopeptidase [Rhodanobacter sp. MP7CTX1]|uniref:CPBP family intramembrane glutamic endopeptidase n=1 Tax=Rhodanobacter sp. MP7CTX1 TaxID=2723084 RepID=UPI00161FDF19|nr:CPBP family intramembrane glutamic endopeptidase [Rhodanobacter sp. MP7CTX1]
MLEELAFRAILLRLFARMFNPVAGLVISSALFGVAHLTHGTPFQALEIAFNAGLTMGIPYMITGRLWMSVGMHIGWDFTEESLLGVNTTHGFLLSTPDPTHSVLLTGGAYGPDGSLFAALVGALFVVGMLYSNKRGWFPFRGNP